MNRLGLLTATLALAGGSLFAQDTERAAVYERDVEFLLTELPKQAGRFFALKKIDWAQVSTQFRDEVKAVRNDEEHLKLCGRLLARLRDGHAGIVQSKVKWPDESQSRIWTGPGVHLLVSSGAVYVRAAFGDAAAAGVTTGMRVEKIDGEPALAWLTKKAAAMGETRGFSTEHQALYAACHAGLADWAGTKIALELTTPSGETKRVELTRIGGANYASIGPIFPPKDLKAFERNACGKTASGFAYIHLRKIPGNLDAQLDEMLATIGDAPGLILDTRANGGGGCDHEAVFGRFVPEGKFWGRYQSKGARPFTGPMVVIVDAGVASAGETVAGMFKEDGRAYMIGDAPTAGMFLENDAAAAERIVFGVYFSVFSNKARFNRGRGIEGIGVPPHEVVPYDPKELAAGIDTQIRRAEELLTKGFPDDVVDYEPPKNP